MKEFNSLAAFASHLLEAQVGTVVALHEGLKSIAVHVEKDAKDMIGFYQAETGPFPAWEPLAQSTEDEKARLGYPSDAPLLRTGDLKDSITHEIDGLEAVIGSQSDIAEYQEFGTNTIPPRPFIGPAAFINKGRIERIVGESVVAGITGGQKIHESLGYDFNTQEVK
jgi:HK97 gp10 family phage protein